MTPSRKNIDTLRDLAKQTRDCMVMVQQMVAASDAAIREMTFEKERDRPGSMFLLHLRRKVLRNYACAYDPDTLDHAADQLAAQRDALIEQGINPDE
jgi:hypothetical protein